MRGRIGGGKREDRWQASNLFHEAAVNTEYGNTTDSKKEETPKLGLHRHRNKRGASRLRHQTVRKLHAE